MSAILEKSAARVSAFSAFDRLQAHQLRIIDSVTSELNLFRKNIASVRVMNNVRYGEMIEQVARWHFGVILDYMQHATHPFLFTRRMRSPSNSSG